MTGLATRIWDARSESRDEVLLRTRATSAGGRPHVITVVNLSPSGLMARSDAGLVAGDVLSVELLILGRITIEVRWALGGRLGYRFERPIAVEHYHSLLAALRG